MDFALVYLILAIILVLMFVLLAITYLPSCYHGDVAFIKYQQDVVKTIVEYGYVGDLSDGKVAKVIRIAYANGISVADTVMSITVLFPAMFLTEVLRVKLRKAMLDSTCGHSCDICLKSVKG